MCNLYSNLMAQDAMRQLFDLDELVDHAGNLPEQPEIYPDYLAPIIRNTAGGL
jgi:putative SOS response-associated peptidase YedK